MENRTQLDVTAKAIIWVEDLETGLPKVDKQHKTLVDLINRLKEAIDNKFDKNSISLIFKQLATYTKFHFKSEEVILEGLQVKDLNQHKRLHQDFVGKLRKSEMKYMGGDDNAIVILLEFLTTWLVDHILKEDKEIMGSNKNKKLIKEKFSNLLNNDKDVDDWEWAASQTGK